MTWFASILFATCLLALVFHYWREFSKIEEEHSRAWFLSWVRRGVVTPLVVWMLMNIGSMPFMPPLTRGIGYMRGKGAWFQAFMAQNSLAAVMILAFWGSLTMGWFIVNLFKHAKNTEELKIATFLWMPVLPLSLGLFCYASGWPGMAPGVLFWIWPLTHYLFNAAQFTSPQPMYSKAIGKLKMGKYREAEAAIIDQLEGSATDFDGWMMLADLYAHQFNDLAEAEKTICELCDDPATTLSQVSIAMHRLADWQLKLRRDPLSARRILEELCRRMPGTHLAKMAQIRVSQLPTTINELEDQEQPKRVVMPVVMKDLKDVAKMKLPESPEDALRLANQLVEKLKGDPNDVPAREKLARIFAERLNQIDLAIEQLELLIEMPEQPAVKIAEWLGLMAAWQLEHRGESETVKRILKQLIHEFPQTPQAFEAQRRLSIMNIKPRGQKVRVIEGEPDE